MGKQLVAILDRESEADMISRWMAHYIAQLITSAEQTTGDARAELQQKCFESILALWKHRAYLPDGRRPFEQFDAVLRAWASFDPEKAHSFYHRIPQPREQEKTDSDDTEQLVELVLAIDKAAQTLITELLNEAARGATNENTKLMLENAAGFEPGLDIDCLRLAVFGVGANSESKLSPEEARTEQIQERITKLKAFRNLALKVEHRLKRQIGEA